MADYSGHDPEQPAAVKYAEPHAFVNNPARPLGGPDAVALCDLPGCWQPEAAPVHHGGRGGSVDEVPVAERTAAAAVDAVLHGDEPDDEEAQPAERWAGRDLFSRDQAEPAGRVIVEDRDGDRYLADDVPGAEFRFVSIGGPRYSWATLVREYGPIRVVDDGATLPPLPGPPSVPGELVELERVAGPPMGPYECLVELVRLTGTQGWRSVAELAAAVASVTPAAEVTGRPHQVGDWHPDHPDRVAARAERDRRFREGDGR